MSLQFLADYESATKHEAPVWTIATSSKVVWSASADGHIKAWDIDSGRALGSIQSPHRNAISSLSVSEDQGWLVSNSLDGSTALWRIAPFHEQQSQLPRVDGILPAAGSASEPSAGAEAEDAGATATEQPASSNTGSDEPVITCDAYCPSVARMTFPNERQHLPIDAYTSDLHPFQPILATTGNTATVSLYQITVGTDSSPSETLLSPLRRFRANAIIRPRDYTALASRSSIARTPIPPSARKGWGMCVRFTPSGSMVAVGTDSGQVIVHDTETGAVLASFSNHAAPIRSITFALVPQVLAQMSVSAMANGHAHTNGTSVEQLDKRLDHLVVGSEDLTISLHDARDLRENGAEASGTVVSMLQGHSKMVVDASLREDGRILASLSTDKAIKLWDLAASPKACVCTIAEDAAMWCLRWIDNAKFVAAGDDGRVKWYRGAGAVTSAGEDL